MVFLKIDALKNIEQEEMVEQYLRVQRPSKNTIAYLP